MSNNKPTHVYYNVRIQNGRTDGKDDICSFREQRTIPIVDNPSEYYMSCIRFNIPTSRLPILLIPVQPFPNTNPEITIYSVTLSYGGSSSTQPILWQPTEAIVENIMIRPEVLLSATSPFTKSHDTYYHCHSYVQLMELVNVALQKAFNNLTSKPAAAKPPFYTFDAVSGLFTLKAQAATYDVQTVVDPIKIYLNNDLFTLFSAMNSLKINNPEGEKDRQILICANVDNSNVDANGYINFTQEYSTLVGWVGFTSIVITSGTIPIESEGIPTTTPFFSNTSLQQTGLPSFLNIISDFDALLTDGYKEFQTTIQYNPSGEYRLIDLNGTNPLTSFDIQVLWSDVFGGLHNLKIAPNESATFKFMFRKRNFNYK